MDKAAAFRDLIYQCIIDLSTEDGINASSKDEIFGCIFGRDCAITILKILNVCKRKPFPILLDISKRALLTLVELQGKQINIESGEEPGKFIHEFRENNYERLIKRDRPWYLYEDKKLRNYDSIDSTPLALIALYRYYELTKDNEFLLKILSSVEAGINWIITYGDRDKDLLFEYEFDQSRKHGGLVVQSWTDSAESLLDKKGRMPKYPIAPVEVQAFAWLALKLWGDFYKTQSLSFSKKLLYHSQALKKRFNEMFVIEDGNYYYGAQALDGDKRKIKTITANPLLCLYAMYEKNGEKESILEDKYIDDFVKRAFQKDLFVEDAGIRTMSSNSPTFNPNKDSYHNGSFWPMLNGLITEGLENFGYFDEALKLKNASLTPLWHFQTPIELYIKKGENFMAYCSSTGQKSCMQQAWSAAAILDWLTV